ncbi:hypothetical protein REPUB_Repub11eG0067900 [Reevesia pubescens]
MNYIVLMVQQRIAKDLVKAVLSVTGHCCSSYNTFFHEGNSDQQSLVCGFTYLFTGGFDANYAGQ